MRARVDSANPPRVSLVVLTVIGCVLAREQPAAAAPASVDEAKTACLQSSEKAQLLRRKGKLAAARAALDVCGADSCPRIVRDDCRTWTAELQAAQPTVVFSVRGGDGVDLVDAKVTVDGAPFVDRIDGLPRPIDPGPHDVEVTAPSETPVRLRIVVHEGEKQRVLPVLFPARRGHADGGTGPTADGVSAAPITPWVYVSGAVAVAGIAGFAYLGLTALSDHAALRDGCATTHSCSDGAVQSNKARFWAADASLLVGLIGAGVTGYLLYDHAHRPAAPRAGDIRVSGRVLGGPFVELQTLF